MGLAAGWSADDARVAWGWKCAAPHQAALETRSLGDITLLRVAAPADPHTEGLPRIFTPPRGAVVLVALTRGGCEFTAADAGRRRLRRKEVLLALGGAPLELAPDAGARLVGLAAPAHLLAPRFVSAERLRAGALMSHAGGVAGLLYDLVTRLTGGEARTSGAGALVDAIGGLLSATLETCGCEPRPRRGAVASTRLQQIGRHLRRHFADPELSAADVAAAVGVSRRYLHRLYAGNGRSFREELIALRIEACLAAFQDEAQADKTIAEIAYCAGYADISQFNRHFRRLRGETPSALRRAAQGHGADAAGAPQRPEPVSSAAVAGGAA